MAKYTIELEDTAGFARRLRVQEEAHLGFPEAAAQFGEVAAQLEAQLPKPVPEEPTGDVLVDVDGELLRPRPPHWIPCVGYTNNPPTWAELVDGLEPGQIKIYDARPLATPPTEEVAAADELMVGAGFSPKPDPLEALYAELKDEWELDAGDWVILRNFVERVRALTTKDTGELVKAAGRLIDMWDSSPSTVKRITTDYPGLDHAIDLMRRNLPKAGQ